MKRLKVILTTLLIGMIAVSLEAQPGNPASRQKIESYRVAFITKRVGLTPSEAQAFWPVYNNYLAKREQLRIQERNEARKARSNPDALSDAEVEKLIDQRIEFEQKRVDLLKGFHSSVKKILAPKKVAKLYKAEDDFKRELIRLLKEKG